MSSLNPTVFVTAVMEPLTWYSTMEVVSGNNYVVDASDDPRMRYLVNNTCVRVGRELKTAATTNSFIGRGGVPIPLVISSVMGTKG